jgi:hypothetical protein
MFAQGTLLNDIFFQVELGCGKWASFYACLAGDTEIWIDENDPISSPGYSTNGTSIDAGRFATMHTSYVLKG